MNKKNRYTLADKQEYIMIDILKYIATYLVASIHLLPFRGDFAFWWTQVFCRVAVPFYFIASGYFLYGKLRDKEKLKGYVFRLAQLYVIYTIIHQALIRNYYISLGYRIRECFANFFKDFFFEGSYLQFWYFPATIYASVILFLILNYTKITTRGLLILGGVLYTIGTLGNAYVNVFTDVLPFENAVNVFFTFCSTTRNGIFFGLPLVIVGYLLRLYADKIKQGPYWILAVLGLGLMTAEAYLAQYLIQYTGSSMLFATPFAAICLFLAAAFMRLPVNWSKAGVFIRNVSVVVYAMNMWVDFQYSRYIPPECGSEVVFLLIMAMTTVIAVGVVYLSRYKFFEWMKYLY